MEEFGGRTAPVGQLSTTQMYELSKQKEEEDVDWALPTLKATMSPWAVKRLYDRRDSQFTEDPDWQLTDDDLKSLMAQGYNEKDLEHLNSARSQTQFAAMKVDIEEDRAMMQAMGSGGLPATGLAMAASVVDIPNLAVGYATGGLSFLNTGSKFVRGAKMALYGGASNLAMEGLLYSSNTQATTESLVLAFGAGSILSGGISMLTHPKTAKAAIGADDALSRDANAYVSKSYNDKTVSPISAKYPHVDSVEVAKRLEAHDTLLRNGVDKEPTFDSISKGKDTLLGRLRNVDDELKVAKKEIPTPETLKMNAKIAAQAKHGKSLLEAEEAAAASFKKVEPQVKEQEALISKFQGKRYSKKVASKVKGAEAKIAAFMNTPEAGAVKLVKDTMKLDIEDAVKNPPPSKFDTLITEKTEIQANLHDTYKQLADVNMERLAGKRAALAEWDEMSIEGKIDVVYKGEELPDLAKKVQAELKARGLEPEPYVAPKKVETDVGGTGGAMDIGDTPGRKLHDVAQAAKRKITQYTVDGVSAPENLVGSMLPGSLKSKFVRGLHAVHTRLSNSNDSLTKGITYRWMDSPQGGSQAATTVASRQDNFLHRMHNAGRNKLNEAISDYGREFGYGHANLQKLYKDIFLEVAGAGRAVGNSVRHGAKGVADQLAEAGRIAKAEGVGGTKELEITGKYIPHHHDNKAIMRALGRHAENEEDVIGALSLGFQHGARKLDVESADRVAGLIVKRAKDSELAKDVSFKPTAEKDIDQIRQDLEKVGLSQDDIDAFLEINADREMRQYMADVFKPSLRPDITKEYNGIRVVDLIDTDLPTIVEAYSRHSAGASAFAREGFKTEAEVREFLKQARANSLNRFGTEKHIVQEEYDILNDFTTMIYGRSLNKNAGSTALKNLGRAKSLTSTAMLQFHGIKSAPELAKATVNRSLSTLTDALEDFNPILGSKKFREGGKYSGTFKNPELAELEESVHGFGEDFMYRSIVQGFDDIEDAGSSKVGQLIDRLLAKGQRITEVTSGMRAIQGGGEMWGFRALNSQIKGWIHKGGKAIKRAEISRAGWDDGFMDELKVWCQANKKTVMDGDIERTLWNAKAMPADMLERLQIGTARINKAEMHRCLIGEEPLYLNKWLGSTLTQFRSFAITSIEKQLMHDIKHDKVMGSIKMMTSSFFAYTALAVASAHKHAGKSNMWELMEEDLTGDNAVVGVISNIANMAGPSIVFDIMATAGLLPEAAIRRFDKPGANVMSPMSVPIISEAKGIMNSGSSIMGVLKGDEEKSRAELLQKAINDNKKLLPFTKMIGINQGFNLLDSYLENQ